MFFFIKFLKKDFKDNTKIKVFNKFIRITYPAKNNEKLKKDFDIFRKNIKIYYEFPPITKFNYKKRFKKILNNFKGVVPKDYKVKLPIFSNSKIHLDKELKNELNVQYSNICYIKLTN